jgi:hypothetical protein
MTLCAMVQGSANSVASAKRLALAKLAMPSDARWGPH